MVLVKECTNHDSHAKTCFKEDILVEYVFHTNLVKLNELSVQDTIQVINIQGNTSIILNLYPY